MACSPVSHPWKSSGGTGTAAAQAVQPFPAPGVRMPRSAPAGAAEAVMAKETRTALELARIIRGHLGAPELKIGVFFDKANGWRAVAYSSENVAAKQAQVDEIVRELREWFTLGD